MKHLLNSLPMIVVVLLGIHPERIIGQACNFISNPAALAASYPQLATCSAGIPSDPVMVLTDAPYEDYNSNTYPTATSVPGAGNGVVDKFMHPDWSVEKLGPIYFTEFGSDGSIYAPSSRFMISPDYGGEEVDFAGTIGSAYANASTGNFSGRDVIYKTDPLTGAVSGWALIATNERGFGGMTFDPVTNTFYVVNMGDNTIYQLSNAGSVLSSYTPSLGNSSLNSISWPDISNFQNQPFGIDIHPRERKLFYTVIRADNQLEVRSVELDQGGLMTGADVREVWRDFVVAFEEEGLPVIADIDISITGNMVVGSFTSLGDIDTYYHSLQANSLYNHNAAVYGFSESGDVWNTLFISSVGQEAYSSGGTNSTATGGVAWNTDPSLPSEVVWMSGGDFRSEDSAFGVVGYNYNQISANNNNEESASSYIQWLFDASNLSSNDPKGNGGDVDIYGYCLFCNFTCDIINPVNETCANAGDGSFTVDVTSIDPTYSNFELSINEGVSWSSNPNFTGLSLGEYTVQVREIGDPNSCTTCTVTLECTNQTEQFGDRTFIGNANASSQGGDDPQHLSGPIEIAGTAISGNSTSGNSTLINGTNPTVILVFDEVLPVGGTVTISLADNNGSGNVTISDGNPAGDIIFSGGTQDVLQHLLFTITQATSSLTISRNAGGTWIDGAAYDFTANVSLGYTCNDCSSANPCEGMTMPKFELKGGE